MAHNNETLLYDWFNKHFQVRADGDPFLLVMDVVTFHKTSKSLALLKELNISPTMIPPDCTVYGFAPATRYSSQCAV
ncbi:hypothetical protein E4U61_000294 [Claviceps capensis]|nr:hypothetical protein E4U61_000294 [Claviceps capensis]